MIYLTVTRLMLKRFLRNEFPYTLITSFIELTAAMIVSVIISSKLGLNTKGAQQ